LASSLDPRVTQTAMDDTALTEPARVLLVDDNADQLEMVADLLRLAGFNVQTSSDALNGFDATPTTQSSIMEY
jgi:PleD family two-component response regulator